MRFDAYMKEDVPDIPAEVRFRIPLSRALVGCCCPQFAPADASSPNRLPAHIRNATHGRATGSGCLISATSWWTTPFESVNSNRFGLSVSFVQSLHLNMLTDGAIRSDIKDAIDTGCLARRVLAEHTTSRAEIVNSIVDG